MKVQRKASVRPATKVFVPVDMRSDIGVISPFSLAEAILGERIAWTKKTKAGGREILEDALGMDYASLFSPVSGSPLYKGLPSLKTASKARPEVAVEKMRASVSKPLTKVKPEIRTQTGWGNLLRMLASLFRPEPAQTVRSAEVTAPLASDISTGAPLPCTANVEWRTDPAWIYPPPPAPAGDYSPLFGTHSIQGCAADCYFIAALSSLAWIDPASLSGTPDLSGNYEYWFTDTDELLNPLGDAQEISVDEPLPVNRDTGELAYAHSRIPNQVWPAVYEKAFAKFKGIMPPTAPNIPGLGFGNPIHALCCLTFTYGTARLTAGYDGHKLWQEINQLCGSGMNGDKTQYPIVAWTYPQTPADPNLSYSTDILVANHSYSILGTAVLNGSECIVLRNPYVYSVAGSPPQGVIDGTWEFTDWYGLGGAESAGRLQMKLRTTDESIGDGTFALEAGAFVKYFEGLGWVGF